jgi:hypothetical protein
MGLGAITWGFRGVLAEAARLLSGNNDPITQVPALVGAGPEMLAPSNLKRCDMTTSLRHDAHDVPSPDTNWLGE